MRGTRIPLFVSVCAALWSSAAVLAESKSFDFKDPKGVNTISFLLDSQVEPILGLASGVTGAVEFDPTDGKRLSGTLVVEAATLHTQNPGMREKLHSDEWLDVGKYPTIEFNIKEVKSAKKTGDGQFDLQAVGDFTCRGVTKELTIPVKASYLPGKLSSRMRGAEGDLLVLRANFKIKRADFQIKPDVPDAVVADEIEIRANIVGACPK